MSEDIITRSSEASKGGYAAVRAVEGIFQPVVRQESTFTDEEGNPAKDQAVIKLADAVILEMEEGEDEPELKEGAFTAYAAYAKRGQPKPHQNSLFVKGLVKSAEALAASRGIKDGGLSDIYHTRIRLERKDILLFSRPIEQGSEEKEDIIFEGWVMVEADGTGGGNVEEYLKGKLIGLNQKAAKRVLVMDNRAKKLPELKEELENGTLGKRLGLVEKDGVFFEANPES